MKTLFVLLVLMAAAAAPSFGQPASEVTFVTYTGDPQKPETMSFQIKVRGQQPLSQFLKLGEILRPSGHRLERFTRKAGSGGVADQSELTLQHAHTKEETVLPLGKPVSLPAVLISDPPSAFPPRP